MWHRLGCKIQAAFFEPGRLRDFAFKPSKARPTAPQQRVRARQSHETPPTRARRLNARRRAQKNAIYLQVNQQKHG